MKKKLKTGEFGPIYTQFKNKPKDAIKHLKKVKLANVSRHYIVKILDMLILFGAKTMKIIEVIDRSISLKNTEKSSRNFKKRTLRLKI
ncbi:MAG: hypothetical protein FWE63_00155 [Bacteroidales bacterium]|nr:hypothetical protein [Bacteroidales bacterium]